MALLEDRTAVFIVRVWCERGDGDAAVTEWRGSVEHIQSGQRAFFRAQRFVVGTAHSFNLARSLSIA